MRCEANAVMTADGLQGLWRGLLPSLYRTVPGVGLYFSSMHWMRYNVFNGKPNAGQDQDGVWCLPISVGVHSTELDPLCREPSRT